MPVDLKVLERRGCTIDALKEKFNVDSIQPGSKIAEFLKFSAYRINDGIERNLRDCRFWWAIDKAYDAAQRQISFTLVQNLLDRQPSDNKAVLSAAKEWGLDKMLGPVLDDRGQPVRDSRGDLLYKFDLPTFFHIYVPIVQAYQKIRVAKLFNDRDLYPFYRYEPIKLTMKNRLKSEIITDRIQRMVEQMGYRADERQSIHSALLYGICLNFPQEEWWKDEQIILEDGQEKTMVVREGIRYAIPHPSRTFYDLNYRLSTFNSDTGCEWAGYWDILRYGDVAANSGYWNRDKIARKYKWMGNSSWQIYQELFPCRFKFPDLSTGAKEGAGEQDRLDRAQYYSRNEEDQAITVVPLFQKLVPKEWGLYDYDKPVWHRFLFAAEDTVIFAAPMAYSPVVAYTYDHDQNRAFNTSLGLELLPWQDHIGNYLSQYLLSVKQNLAKVIFWNKDLLDEKYVKLISNLGEKIHREMNMIPFSRTEWTWQKQTEHDVFHPVQFGQLNTQEIATAIHTMISIMERILGYSSQEIGASATHEESATEVQIKQANVSVRLNFTGSFIDEARQARKRQLYDATMAYSSDQVMAEVADLNEQKKKALEEMGFKIEEEEYGQETKAGVIGDKSALVIDGFASDRDGINRVSDVKIATTMIQTFQAMFSNPAIVQATGIRQLIEMFNQILYYSGLPRDFRLRLDENQADQAQVTGVQEQLTVMLKAIQDQMQQMAAAAAKQAVEVSNGELQTMATELRDKVIVPIEQRQEQMTQAIVELLKRQQASDAKDAVQDQALSKLIEVFETAAQPMPPTVSLPAA